MHITVYVLWSGMPKLLVARATLRLLLLVGCGEKYKMSLFLIHTFQVFLNLESVFIKMQLIVKKVNTTTGACGLLDCCTMYIYNNFLLVCAEYIHTLDLFLN